MSEPIGKPEQTPERYTPKRRKFDEKYYAKITFSMVKLNLKFRTIILLAFVTIILSIPLFVIFLFFQ